MNSIKHIWFDFSKTIAVVDKETHDKIVHKAYSDATGKPATPELMQEYRDLHKKYTGHSETFASLGLGAGYLSEYLTSPGKQPPFTLVEDIIPETLERLKDIVPISIWSNIHAERVLSSLGIDPAWFTNFLSPDEVKNPKPALDGFKMMIERSGLPPENILFVGDGVQKEIIPAKSLGIKTCLMWTEDPRADYCCKSFKEILDIMK